MAKTNRPTTQAHDAQMIVGIKKDLQNVSSLILNAVTFTPTTLAALLQSRIDAANEAEVARANWIAASQKYKAIDTQAVPVVSGFKQYVLNTFGKTSVLLADFGVAAPKRTPMTPEQKQAAVAKRAATRKARGTTGPKAKLAVTGETVRIAGLEANQQVPAAGTGTGTAAPAAATGAQGTPAATPAAPVQGATGTAAQK
jgi:hypothetical protein